MLKLTWRSAAAGACALVLPVLAGCSERSAPPAPPPPPHVDQAPPPALLGGPPPREFTAMAPIPNPGDMTPTERARVYGYHYGRAHYVPRHHHRVPVHAAAPVQTVTPAPKPAAVAPPPPVVKPTLTQAPAPLTQLETAVSGDVAGKAKLAVPADLSAAKPGKVTLSLPDSLLDTIRKEAAKFGLGKPARHTDVTATLSGDGYSITPNGAQTAHLKSGQPTTFSWLVQPGPNAKGTLKADVKAVLNGAGAAESFSVAKLEQAVTAVEDAANAAAAGAKGAKFSLPKFKLPDMLSIPGLKTLTLPGFGKIPSKSLVAAGLLLLAIILLAMAARGSSSRRQRQERQRKFRTMASEPVSHADEHVSHAYASPDLVPIPVEVEHHAETPTEVYHEEHAPAAHAEPVPAEEAHAETLAHEPEAEVHAEPVLAEAHDEPPAEAAPEAHGEDDHGQEGDHDHAHEHALEHT